MTFKHSRILGKLFSSGQIKMRLRLRWLGRSLLPLAKQKWVPLESTFCKLSQKDKPPQLWENSLVLYERDTNRTMPFSQSERFFFLYVVVSSKAQVWSLKSSAFKVIFWREREQQRHAHVLCICFSFLFRSRQRHKQLFLVGIYIYIYMCRV